MLTSVCFEYHDLAKIGIKNIFYFGMENWSYKEKIIETIDGKQWDYNAEENVYTERTKLLLIA